MPRANNLSDLNRQLLAFSLAERVRIVAHQSKTIGQNFELDKTSAMSLPALRFDACIQRAGLVDKYQTVIFETNPYSVPPGAAFAKVTVKAYVDRLAIVNMGHVVAEHRRGYGQHESFIDPLHFVARAGTQTSMAGSCAAIRDWQLPGSFERLRQTFNGHHGLPSKRAAGVLPRRDQLVKSIFMPVVPRLGSGHIEAPRADAE